MAVLTINLNELSMKKLRKNPLKITTHILIVDDDESTRELLELQLLTAGYPVLEASDGREALNILSARTDVTLLITDYLMPGMNGVELATQARDLHPDLELILLTAKEEFAVARECIHLQVVDYIVKPVSLRDLVGVVDKAWNRATIRRRSATASGQIFLSYAREDLAAVQALALKLRRAGYLVWLDVDNLVPGTDWADAIKAAISASTIFVSCLSRRSVSKRGIFQRELRAAMDAQALMLDSDIYLIPLRLEECTVPPKLQAIQWIDYFQPNGWIRLVDALEESKRRREDA